MLIHFAATEPILSLSLASSGSQSAAGDRLTLTLLAGEDAGVVVNGGKPLSAISISLTFYANIPPAGTLRAKMKPGTIGFLSFIDDNSSGPFIYGAVLWDRGEFPDHYLQAGIGLSVAMEIPNLQEQAEWDDPFEWLPGVENHLLIQEISIVSRVRG